MPGKNKVVTNNSTRILRIGVTAIKGDGAEYVRLMPGENVISEEDWKRCMENARARKWCEKGTLKGRTGKMEKEALLTVEDERGQRKTTTRAKKGAKVEKDELTETPAGG